MQTNRLIRIFLVPTLIVTAVFVIPGFSLKSDISVLLTIVTFLFTIVIGFLIASATSNYLSLQSVIAQEDAALIDIYNAGGYVQPSKRKILAETIDLYLIACLGHDFSSYVMGTQDEFKKLVSVVDSLVPKNNISSPIIQNLHNDLFTMTQTRQTALLASRKVVKSVHWFILILLTLIIFALLLVLRDQSVLQNIFLGMMASATYLLMVLLYEIDSNVFLEDVNSYIDVEPVFLAIGKLVYYPDFAFQNGNFKPRQVKYRLGQHDRLGNLTIRQINGKHKK